MRRLIVVAHALAPGPGEPESQVNLELVRALVTGWLDGVTVISGGEPPALRERVSPRRQIKDLLRLLERIS